MSIIAATQTDASRDANDRTALLAIPTPLSNLSIPSNTADPVIAIVNTRLGAVTIDPSMGAVVRGNGSNLLWLSGTAPAVNADLATLTYTGPTAGTDDLSILVLAPNGTLSPVLRSAISVIPLTTAAAASTNVITFEAGNLTLESRTLDGPKINLREQADSLTPTTCVLIDSTIGVDSQISVRNENDNGVMPRIAMAGRVELDGTIALIGNPTAISLAQGSTFVNEGSIAIDAHAVTFSGSGTLVNNGIIVLTGDGTPGFTPRIDTVVTGSGLISLEAEASLEIGASVAASDTISLGAGANTLHLTQPRSFAGQIAGFSTGDRLVFDGATITSALASRAAETDSTVVTLINGASVVGTLRFTAPEPGTIVQLGTDASGNPTLALAPASADDPASVDVFRFFDAARGTQLLTQDPSERDAILSGRPDLHYEGVGLHALDPAHPDANATAIYRFFDVGTGTHLMTASTAERDALLGDRPDLVFEPGSTFFEHATAQPGDTAVYRFFDSRSGAHFFTGDAGERATILATRPDLTPEGIAFYAPLT